MCLRPAAPRQRSRAGDAAGDAGSISTPELPRPEGPNRHGLCSTTHRACGARKVRQHFALILAGAIRQEEVASAPEEAEASARSGQSAAGGGSEAAMLPWAGML